MQIRAILFSLAVFSLSLTVNSAPASNLNRIDELRMEHRLLEEESRIINTQIVELVTEFNRTTPTQLEHFYFRLTMNLFQQQVNENGDAMEEIEREIGE
jgi:hypothetical protein